MCTESLKNFGVKEGDVLVLQGDKWCIDEATAQQRKEKIRNELNRLFVD